jgi:cell fate regulator YaaT (PSP1 superfamily)
LEENKKREKDAFKICEDKIREHNLEMKLVDVEYTFDNNKILFYFTADGRVDFRALVKDLATVFRTRIELRQIGVRDEAKMLGGLGVCGRPFCCSGFLGEFQPVSIKMAKEQGLSLSPVKISGTCGRLMCCLKYEQDAYTDLINKTPKVGQKVKTPDGIGTVVDVALLTGTIKVKLDGAVEEAAPQVFNLKQLKTLGGKGCCCKNQEEIPEFLPETDEDDFDEFISEYFPENKSQSKGNRNTGDKPIREEKQEKRQNYRGNNKRQNYQNKGKRPYRNNRPKRDNNRNKNDNRD